MKKISAVLLFCLLYLLSLQGFDVIRDGKIVPVYIDKKEMVSYHKDRIFTLNQPMSEVQSLTQQLALDDLIACLEKMTGKKVELRQVANTTEVKAPAIVVGRLAREMGAIPTRDNKLQEALAIKADDDYLLIGGNGPAGVGYGIYDLLGSLGCDWVMPGLEGEVIPENVTNLTYSNGVKEQIPSFVLRMPWYNGGLGIVSEKDVNEFNQWVLRQKSQHFTGTHPDFQNGGHVWTTVIGENKKLFDDNPELYALVKQSDGTFKRQGPQLESTDLRNIQLGVDYVRNLFKQNKWANDKVVLLGLGPADGTWFSESSASLMVGGRRIDPMTGELISSDLVLKYVLDVLMQLKDEFPNLRVGYYVYSSHSDYPRMYLPNDRFTLTIADINYSRFAGMNDKSSKTRSFFADLMKNWVNLAKENKTELQLYLYNWNLAENFMPFTKLKAWGEDVKWFHENGIKGHNSEYVKAWGINGPHDYLLAKMSWDVTVDWREILKEYCIKAFGVKAAPYMERYYLRLAAYQSKAGQEAGSYYSFNLIFDDAFILESEADFVMARNLAGNELEKKRINYASFPLTSLKQYLAFRDAYSHFDFTRAEKILNEIIADLKKEYEKNPQVSDITARNYLELFMRKFVTAGKQYSTGDFHIVEPLPDRLATMFDSTNSGAEMGYFNPELNDANYLKSATYSTTWDAQGLAGFRGCSIWYRHHFKLAENLTGKPVGLFIGGAENIVNVWLDGEYIGNASGYSTPFIFDLTDHINPGKEQLLAIQVSAPILSELNVGGLVLPSYIFTGKERPKDVQNNRKEILLPGGAVQ